jgi:hypothetical protein
MTTQTCPKCESNKVVGMPDGSYRCHRCHHTWRNLGKPGGAGEGPGRYHEEPGDEVTTIGLVILVWFIVWCIPGC